MIVPTLRRMTSFTWKSSKATPRPVSISYLISLSWIVDFPVPVFSDDVDMGKPVSLLYTKFFVLISEVGLVEVGDGIGGS